MHRISVFIILLIIIKTSLYAQTGFDYFPKSLLTQLSKTDIAASDLKEITLSPALSRSIKMGKYFNIPVKNEHTPINYVYVGRVNTCRTGGCSISQNFEGESEYFDYFILFNTAGAVQQVKIYNYQSTHGQEVTSSNWLKQFRNFDGKKELIVGKNVDAISGATVSVNATAFDIEHKTKTLQSIIQ